MREKRRVQAIAIGEDLIENMLQLPKGVRVTGLHQSWDRRCIMVRIEPTIGGGWEVCFPEVEDGEFIPIIDLEFSEFTPGFMFEVRFKWWFFSAVRRRRHRIYVWFGTKSLKVQEWIHAQVQKLRR